MRQRIYTLTRYLLRDLARSVTGLFYLLFAFAYWLILFPPGQGTPDIDNYILIIAVFGMVATFLATLSITTRANHALNYPLVARLASRVEYLTAVLFAAILFALALQLLVAILALIRGPDITLWHVIELPPIWIAPNILAAVLALHASDFVTSGWSRVYIYGILGIFLFAQTNGGTVSGWIATLSNTISDLLFRQDWVFLGTQFSNLSDWLTRDSSANLAELLGFLFWPFRALIEAVTRGSFTPTEALAPAIMLLYATILFLLASDFFATKDLELTE
ncbi:MAG: hypothetical protein AAF614_05385 [Chloroflexota bacterium]